MDRDYSHIQGSDYAYVPQKPQQPNLIQGLFEAFNGFKQAKAGKMAEDEAKAEKDRQRLQGEQKSLRDEEDRQLNRKKLQGDIDYTEAKKLELGKPKASGKSSGSGSGAEKGTYNYKDAVKSYKDYHKIITGIKESAILDDEQKDQEVRAYEKAALSELKSIVDNGDKLNPFQQEMFDKKYKLYYDEAGAPIRYDGDFSEEENKAYYTGKPPVTQWQATQGGVGQQEPSLPTTEAPKPNPFAGLPTLKNFGQRQQSKLLGPTPFEQYQGMMQNETQEPNFATEPTQGPLVDDNIKVAPPLETKGGYGIMAGKAEDAVVEGAKGLANMAKTAIGSEAGQYVAGGVGDLVSALKETGRSIANVAGGNSRESSDWTKSDEDLDSGIKNVLDYPKENREQLKQIRDNEKFYSERLTPQGRLRLQEAYIEAGLGERPTFDKNKKYPEKMGGKPLLETLKGMNLEGMFDKKDNINGQIFGTPQINMAESKGPNRKTGKEILMGERPLRR